MNDRDLYVNVVGEKKKDYWLKGMEKVIMYSSWVWEQCYGSRT
jgi:hypothetical protein